MSLNQELIWLEPMSPKEIIEDVLVKKYKKDKFVVLYSGGQDSGCVDNFIATEFPEYYEGRLFTNTGIGSPVTRKFALEYSKQLGRKIEIHYGLSEVSIMVLLSKTINKNWRLLFYFWSQKKRILD